MAKQTYIVKAPKSVIRVDEKYILDVSTSRLYYVDSDYVVFQFPTKKEMREAFKDIARESAEGQFYIDKANGACYVRVNAQGRTKAEEFSFIASMITPYNYI